MDVHALRSETRRASTSKNLDKTINDDFAALVGRRGHSSTIEFYHALKGSSPRKRIGGLDMGPRVGSKSAEAARGLGRV